MKTSASLLSALLFLAVPAQGGDKLLSQNSDLSSLPQIGTHSPWQEAAKRHLAYPDWEPRRCVRPFPRRCAQPNDACCRVAAAWSGFCRGLGGKSPGRGRQHFHRADRFRVAAHSDAASAARFAIRGVLRGVLQRPQRRPGSLAAPRQFARLRFRDRFVRQTNHAFDIGLSWIRRVSKHDNITTLRRVYD